MTVKNGWIFSYLKNNKNKLLHGSDWYDYRKIITKIHGHLGIFMFVLPFYRIPSHSPCSPQFWTSQVASMRGVSAPLSLPSPSPWLWLWPWKDGYEGFHKWRYPTSWMVYFMGNPIYKWMITGGTPILGNFHLFPWTEDFEPYASQFLGLIRSASPWFAGVTNLEPTTWSHSG